MPNEQPQEMNRHDRSHSRRRLLIPHSESEVKDEDIFAALDPEWPGLQGGLVAYRAGRIEDAKRELLAYFRRRQAPVWFFDGRGGESAEVLRWNSASGETAAGDVMADADRLVRRQFLGSVVHDLGERWDRFPLFDLNGEDDKPLRVTANRFVRMNFIRPLATAYYATGKPEYARTLAAMLEAFTEKLLRLHPYVPDPAPSPEAYTIHFSKNPFRSNMSVAQSALNVIHLMHTDLFYSEWLPDRLAFRLFRYAWYVMLHHRSYDGNRYRHYNHHLFERGVMPWIFGVMFPEFTDLRPLRESGKAVIEAHLLQDFHATGGYDEHSFAYTCQTTLSEFLVKIKRLADLNGIEGLGREGERTLNRVYSYYSGLVLPNGRFPDVGDGGGGPARELLEHGAELFQSRAARAVLNALSLGGGEAAGAREEAEAQRQEDGPRHEDAGPSNDDDRSALPPLAVNDPLTGYLWARESWTRSSSFMLMCNKVHTQQCSHNHIDMLSLILAVRGETLIGEPLARTLYKYVSNGSALDGYVRGLGSHNTVLVHGRAVTKADLQRERRMESQTVHTDVFECGDGFVYARAGHRADPNGSHTREALFVHRGGWLVADTIGTSDAAAGEGRPEQQRSPERDNQDAAKKFAKPHVQRWHLEHGVTAEPVGTAGRALLLRGAASRLLCVWSAASAVTLRLWKQETVLEIESVPDYKQVSDLPWIVDAEFGPGSVGDAELNPRPILDAASVSRSGDRGEYASPEPAPCRLVCLFADVTDAEQPPEALAAQAESLLAQAESLSGPAGWSAADVGALAAAFKQLGRGEDKVE